MNQVLEITEFLESCTERAADAFVGPAALYVAYQAWAPGWHLMPNSFYGDMERAGFRTARVLVEGRQMCVWKGLRLKAEPLPKLGATITMKTIQKHEFGAKVQDSITGYAGTITGFTGYITGCNQYLVQPPVDKDGKFVDGRWIDEDRLILTMAAPPVAPEIKRPGFDSPAPVK